MHLSICDSPPITKKSFEETYISVKLNALTIPSWECQHKADEILQIDP